MPRPYNTKELDRRVNAVAPEDGGKGKAGLYRHPEAIDASTGKLAEAVTLWDPLFGDAQSNAFEQLGYERVGDAPEGYVKKLDITAATQANESTDSLKGLTARMNQLEGVQERNKELEKQLEDLRKEHEHGAKTDSPAVAETVHQTKVDAAEQIKAREQAPDVDPAKEVGDAPTPEDLPEPEQASQELDESTDNPADEPDENEDDKEEETPTVSEKPLSQQNTTELVATAKAEGVELTAEQDTKAKIREAIEAKREEKKGE